MDKSTTLRSQVPNYKECFLFIEKRLYLRFGICAEELERHPFRIRPKDCNLGISHLPKICFIDTVAKLFFLRFKFEIDGPNDLLRALI